MRPIPILVRTGLLSLLAVAAGSSPALAQEPPYFVTYAHYLEEPGNLEIAVATTTGVDCNRGWMGGSTVRGMKPDRWWPGSACGAGTGGVLMPCSARSGGWPGGRFVRRRLPCGSVGQARENRNDARTRRANDVGDDRACPSVPPPCRPARAGRPARRDRRFFDRRNTDRCDGRSGTGGARHYGDRHFETDPLFAFLHASPGPSISSAWNSPLLPARHFFVPARLVVLGQPGRAGQDAQPGLASRAGVLSTTVDPGARGAAPAIQSPACPGTDREAAERNATTRSSSRAADPATVPAA